MHAEKNRLERINAPYALMEPNYHGLIRKAQYMKRIGDSTEKLWPCYSGVFT